MKQQMTSQNYDILDNKYTLLKEIDSGTYGNVYLIRTQNGDLLAAKIFNSNSRYMYINQVKETRIVSLLHHPNIIKYYSSGVGPITVNGQNSGDDKQYFIMEYASNGDLFYFTKKLGKGFLEKHTKLLFWDFLNAVDYCHKKGIYHGDLKVENIVFDKNYNIKIVDFGNAELIDPGDEISKKVIAKIGTESYAAPEVLKKPAQKINGIKADTFSSGVILFVLRVGRQQFLSANENMYQKIKKMSYEEFIQYIQKHSDFEEFINSSDEFKKLYFKMISGEPQERPSLDEILQNGEWFKEIRDLIQKGKLDNLRNELKDELKSRKKRVMMDDDD